ncbi:MAG: phytanoyl-CoA dioxygenase family protein [Rhodospirillales bacterium]
MRISQEQLQKFKVDGFMVLPGLYAETEVSGMRRLVYDMYRTIVPADDLLDSLDAPWETEAFDQRLLEFRTARPKDFGLLFDAVQASYVFHRFTTKEAIVSVAAELLGDPMEKLSCSGFLFRMDPPLDKRNTLTWHQDISYFPQNLDGERGIVISTALQDTPEELGALHVCKSSHLAGTVDPDYSEAGAQGRSEQRAIPDDAVKRYPETICELKRGDTLFFNMNLFHSSGFNNSNRIRFSTICRYHRMMADDYVPFRILHHYDDYAIDRVLGQSDKKHETFRTFFEKG